MHVAVGVRLPKVAMLDPLTTERHLPGRIERLIGNRRLRQRFVGSVLPLDEELGGKILPGVFVRDDLAEALPSGSLEPVCSGCQSVLNSTCARFPELCSDTIASRQPTAREDHR